ncbi:glycosylphosphatidylinositol anchor biosynthesis [Bachmanniomyces sp. S44760]|nr:glycosylphosphatidylinositol anchor biosynthesis [Bachmanniomyces sp. S44760]
MTSTPTSQASTKVDSDASANGDVHNKSFKRRAVELARESATAQDIFLFLIALRILNALSIRTYFQPDEYFQSLEPAWRMAFGGGSGAWITWEWRHDLRSAIHPTIFAAIYKICAGLSSLLRLSTSSKAEVLLVAPKVTQALFAATGDYYTWRFGQKIYGSESNEAWAALALTVLNPWQWFCSTRTLSNCLETTMTVLALSYWPWEWSIDDSELEDEEQWPHGWVDHTDREDLLSELRRSLFLAALACVLRPTNILIWISLACFSLFRGRTEECLMPLGWANKVIWIRISPMPSLRNSGKRAKLLIRESAICGFLVLTLSSLVDRLFYQHWTFPPFNFLYFNLAQSLAIFYGTNDWHYYLTQGFPLLLTTFLPFALVGIYNSLSPPASDAPRQAGLSSLPSLKHTSYQLAFTSLLLPFVLSFITHKEVRFIYPLLPILHLLAARPFTAFFLPALSPASPTNDTTRSVFKKTVLTVIIVINLLIATFSTQYHQTAPLTVLEYLRRTHERLYLTLPPPSANLQTPSTESQTMTVGFLTPCHSTPWRSHLIHPTIKAWALSCEPPINMNASQKNTYIDEADLFYMHPARYLAEHLGPPPRRKGRIGAFGIPGLSKGIRLGNDKTGISQYTAEEIENAAWDGEESEKVTQSQSHKTRNQPQMQTNNNQKRKKKLWPEYLVFFAQMEESLLAILDNSPYRECWRGWNSFAHDDWRRKGDLIVWCIGDREAREWREKVKGKEKAEAEVQPEPESKAQSGENQGGGFATWSRGFWKWIDGMGYAVAWMGL